MFQFLGHGGRIWQEETVQCLRLGHIAVTIIELVSSKRSTSDLRDVGEDYSFFFFFQYG